MTHDHTITHDRSWGDLRVAVILPCRNEAIAIGGVVQSFQAALPSARIYVIDNASTDDTASIAADAGAEVRYEPRPGKGNAVRRAFADIDADVYIMADGDGTYDAARSREMVDQLVRDSLDMIVGVRFHDEGAAYRPGHVLGNRMFNFLFRTFFFEPYTDILSGYRVLSRRFVKSFPLAAAGFEIELEMAAHAALIRAPSAEVKTAYAARPPGGESKLRTLKDGTMILRRMFRFLRLHKPRLVYGVIGAIGMAGVAALVVPIVLEYLQTGLVPRFPTLIVASALMVVVVQLLVAGIILDAQAQYFAETKRLAYLRIPAVSPSSFKEDRA